MRFPPSFAWTNFGPHRLPVAASLALFGLIVVQFALPDGSEGQTVLAAGRATNAEDPQIPAAEWPAIAERPLFAPNRRPTQSRNAGPSSLEGYTVLGIGVMNSAGTAVVRTPAGKSARLLPGQRLDDWTLTQIDLKQLVFKKDGESKILPFDAKRLRFSAERPGVRPKNDP